MSPPLPSSPTTVAGIPEHTVEPPLTLKSEWSMVKASAKANRTVNPIRKIVDPIVASMQKDGEHKNGRKHISLALGDPTAGGNLPSCPVAARVIQDVCNQAQPAAGYVNACGEPLARKAVADFHGASVDSVIIANGCSGALELTLTALLDNDSILLVPQPGFPLYQVICESHGAQVLQYRLLPDEDWQVDLDHIRELVIRYGDRIKGLLVNNPSNPTGAVYSLEHLKEIVSLCNDCHLPIIADEVYGDIVFSDHYFYPLADVAADCGRHVPVINASGIGKQFLLPGWRVGWIVFQDNVFQSLKEVESGAKRLAQVILGASHLAQKAIPALLNRDDPEVRDWKANLNGTLERQVGVICNGLDGANGIRIMKPGGAMYAMFCIDVSAFDDCIYDDVTFSELLLKEENVFILPGSCFGASNTCRLVVCSSEEILVDACERIRQFCERHKSL